MSTGHVVVADSGNNAVRKVSAQGSGAPTVGTRTLKLTARTPAAVHMLHDAVTLPQIDVDTSAVTTIAGTGAPGLSGDGGSALAATLNGPLGLSVGTNDVIYIADTLNHRIRVSDTHALRGRCRVLTRPATVSTALLLCPAARLQAVYPNGNIATVIGSTPGYSGDYGVAT